MLVAFLVRIVTIAALWLAPCRFAAMPGQDFLTPAEKTQLDREEKIDNRIQIYETASARIHRSIQTGIKKQEFEGLDEEMKSWLKLLSASLEDIEGNIETKKKSKALIRFEIQLRKTISNLQDLKLKLPHELHDSFDSSLDQAEKTRKRFVDILFQRQR